MALCCFGSFSAPLPQEVEDYVRANVGYVTMIHHAPGFILNQIMGNQSCTETYYSYFDLEVRTPGYLSLQVPK